MTTLNFNDLEFEVLDTLVAKRFAKFLKEHIHESREFYFMGDSEEQVLTEIDKMVYMLGHEPTRNMNKIHSYFADHEGGNFDEPEMSRLNNLIHYYELIVNGFPPRWGYMVGTTDMELFPADYEEFTLLRKPGWLYVNYPHVGKHFAEIAYTRDYEIAEHQYIPQDMCRPSFHIWLGDEITPLMLEGNMNLLLARAHKKLKDRLNLPDLDHPDMRIGYIPFAKLSDDINTNELTNHLLKCKRQSKNQWELFDGGRQ
tara:strand:- start:2042 stop:2809 length:768 start_codon:yes stop_codon:yes gene_type:complete